MSVLGMRRCWWYVRGVSAFVNALEGQQGATDGGASGTVKLWCASFVLLNGSPR